LEGAEIINIPERVKIILIFLLGHFVKLCRKSENTGLKPELNIRYFDLKLGENVCYSGIYISICKKIIENELQFFT